MRKVTENDITVPDTVNNIRLGKHKYSNTV